MQKPHSKSEVDGKSKGTKGEKVKKSTVPLEKVSTDANEGKNKKKWKRKQANDLRFEAGMEKLDCVSTRKQRKKELYGPYSAVQLFAYENYKLILESFTVVVVNSLFNCLIYLILGSFRNFFGERMRNYQFWEG
ncbi:uncharacterized protein LOC110685626 [Chenopodium quinoa]|uniref:uncharacterized protein LOC110685626 n=1 Tax=Chenopodium quinoa TaxID=63459 RepID=UPI000B787A98|nr:uncharacterized protein LOC110685626 [Chenopodium quinoa]